MRITSKLQYNIDQKLKITSKIQYLITKKSKSKPKCTKYRQKYKTKRQKKCRILTKNDNKTKNHLENTL